MEDSLNNSFPGYAEGVYINGSHWYHDPFNLFGEYSVDHLLEILGENQINNYSALVQDQENMFIFYSIIKQEPEPIPVPVPEPNTTFLLILGYFLILIKKGFKIRTPKRF